MGFYCAHLNEELNGMPPSKWTVSVPVRWLEREEGFLLALPLVKVRSHFEQKGMDHIHWQN